MLFVVHAPQDFAAAVSMGSRCFGYLFVSQVLDVAVSVGIPVSGALLALLVRFFCVLVFVFVLLLVHAPDALGDRRLFRGYIIIRTQYERCSSLRRGRRGKPPEACGFLL